MKNNQIIYIVTIGFAGVLLLIGALILVAIAQIESVNDRMSLLAEETNVKTDAVHNMRDAIRQRENSIDKMIHMDDPFERDEESLRFQKYATRYRVSELILDKTLRSLVEQKIYTDLKAATKRSYADNLEAIDLIMAGEKSAIINEKLSTTLFHQDRVLELLDELVNLQRENAKKAIKTNRQEYRQTKNLLILLGTIVLLLAILIAYLVIKRAAHSNRKMVHQASHDSLTGLINRREFEQRLTNAVTEAKTGEVTHALIYIDLDQFKIINDTCGHIAGDELLKRITANLQPQIRRSDSLARLGGDEFAVILLDCDLGCAETIAQDLIKVVRSIRFSWKEHVFNISASAGIVAITANTENSTVALSAADAACYEAKDAGRNTVHINHFDDLEPNKRQGEMWWVSRINQALEQDRFLLYAQEIMSINDDHESPPCYELLLRMRDSNGKLITPNSFIPPAERYGLMTILDRWVVTAALNWINAHTEKLSGTTFSINLSGRSITDNDFQEFLIHSIKNSRVATNSLCFEITETAMIENLEPVSSFIEIVRQMGCKFALDDFGSGLSSFNYLKSLPVDIVKIDGMFVRDILDNKINYAFVKSINEVAKAMGKRTVAEYVETIAIQKTLKEIGVDSVQGYAIHKPEPLDNILIRQHNLSGIQASAWVLKTGYHLSTE